MNPICREFRGGSRFGRILVGRIANEKQENKLWVKRGQVLNTRTVHSSETIKKQKNKNVTLFPVFQLKLRLLISSINAHSLPSVDKVPTLCVFLV